jgi:radical SAM superfamily enzyme YgiQ (UPF0313 family)
MYCKLIAFNGRFMHSCPALFYVRQALDANLPGSRSEIRQQTINDPYYRTLRGIAAGEPAALFFSVYIWNHAYLERLLPDLAELLPATPVVLGGPQAAALARELPVAVAAHCTVVSGEIEGVDKSFYRDLARGGLKRSYSCTKGASFASPYRAADFAGPLSNRHIYYETSRGCPFACTYCLSGADKGVRHLPVSQVLAEVGEILRHKPRVLRFVDRTFNVVPERALAIWRFLAEQPGDTLFHFEMAPDRFNGEMFRFLEQVGPGRFQFELGVQSTNPDTLAAINRECDLERLRANVTRLAALDTIHIHLDLILGLPHETWESFRRSFGAVFALAPHHIQMGLLKVLPDTPLSRAVDDYGLEFCKKPPYEILANRWLAGPDLAELFWFSEVVETFYNNRFFRNVWNYLRRSNEDIGAFFAGLQELCRERNFFDLAPTQELMSSLLIELSRGRPDARLLRELLVFDWLRSGHRFLPPHLEGEPLPHWRKKLQRSMPQNLEGVYDYRSRDAFFRQGVFVEFSGQLLQEVGLAAEEQRASVCFQAQREATVFGHSRVLCLAGRADR